LKGIYNITILGDVENKLIDGEINMDMRYTVNPRVASQATYDQGLRAYMLSVYNYMGMALALTGGVAYFVAHTPALLHLFLGTPLAYVVMFAPLVMVMFLTARIHSMSLPAVQTSFWAYAAVMGISLASIFVHYQGESIARVFFIAAAMFGTMSIYGYTAKKNLTSFGSFAIMGVIGMLIASLVNIFLHSSALQFVISMVGVVAFTALTAYDSQRIKETYYAAGGNGEIASKLGIMGALTLYLDFINLFISLLQLLGSRRD
jgi:FtsH-binding integral membrane protein